jgi:hypothetical protein
MQGGHIGTPLRLSHALPSSDRASAAPKSAPEPTVETEMSVCRTMGWWPAILPKTAVPGWSRALLGTVGPGGAAKVS